MRDVYHKPMRTLALAILLALCSSARAEPNGPEDAPRDPDRVAAAAAVGALGGASVVTSVVLGVKAWRDYRAWFDSGHCHEQAGGSPRCDATGYAGTANAYTLGNVATGFGIGGALLIGAAAIVYFTAPRVGVTIAPVVSDRGSVLVLEGRF